MVQEQNLNWLPIDPFYVAKKIGCNIFTSTEASSFFKIPRDKVLESKDSDVGLIDIANKTYVIVYNEKAYKPRIPFTIGHEIGHVYLDHLLDFEQTRMFRGKLTNDEYHVLEKEADVFASELLMPLPVLTKLRPLTNTEIMKICNVSFSAADARANFIGNFKGITSREFYTYTLIRKQFQDYLNPISICSSSNIECKICERGKQKKMVVPKQKRYFIPTDDRMRFLICPQCGNDVFSSEAKYCKMCGQYLYNYCVNVDEPDRRGECGRLAFGDARYCEFCGAATELTRAGLLMTWEELIEVERDVSAGIEKELKKYPGDDSAY